MCLVVQMKENFLQIAFALYLLFVAFMSSLGKFADSTIIVEALSIPTMLLSLVSFFVEILTQSSSLLELKSKVFLESSGLKEKVSHLSVSAYKTTLKEVDPFFSENYVPKQAYDDLVSARLDFQLFLVYKKAALTVQVVLKLIKFLIIFCYLLVFIAFTPELKFCFYFPTASVTLWSFFVLFLSIEFKTSISGRISNFIVFFIQSLVEKGSCKATNNKKS